MGAGARKGTGVCPPAPAPCYQSSRPPKRIVNGARMAAGRRNDAPVDRPMVSEAWLLVMLKKSTNAANAACGPS